MYFVVTRKKCAACVRHEFNIDMQVLRDNLSDNLEITTGIVLPYGDRKSLPVHRFSDVIFTFSGPLGL